MQNSKGNPKKFTNRGQQFFYDEHIAAAEGVEIILRQTAASRSLDNITVLLLGLKNLKRTIKLLNEGQTLTQVRQTNAKEQRHVKNTYAQDFEELEVNEQDLNLLSDNDVSSLNEADVAHAVEEKAKRRISGRSPKALRVEPK